MQQIELSIIIVHFNTPELLKTCLNSLYAAKKQEDLWEVIVVDNGSSEDSKKLLTQLQNIEQLKSFLTILYEKENLGFSGGNNVGIRRAQGKKILLLNSDTEVYENAIQQTIQVFKDPKVGAATCLLVLPSGEMDPACHRGFPTPWAAFTYFSGLEKLLPFIPLFSGYHQLYKNFSETHEIDLPTGAFFMIRSEILQTVGLLDERFFMYGEDIDWAYRIKQKGYTILFIPKGKVLHKKGQSGRKSSNTEVQKKNNIAFYETMKQFYEKHYREKYPTIVMKMIFGLLDLKIRMLNSI